MVMHFDPNDVRLEEWIIIVQAFHYVFLFSMFDYHHIVTKDIQNKSFLH
jgi:hypothetical protein